MVDSTHHHFLDFLNTSDLFFRALIQEYAASMLLAFQWIDVLTGQTDASILTFEIYYPTNKINTL